ncbi:MAG TPA: low affinity iron permease family protein [Pyrinomonadaceae bacterium]|jgi:low affinity Fe/Cu permease
MAQKKSGSLSGMLERFSLHITKWAGSSWAFIIAFGIIIVWAVTGPLFKFSDTWQLVINTGTTIVTFLMVFLIQRAQNKDALAIHLKLNEIVASLDGASNRLIDVEDLTETEIKVLHKHYQKLVAMAKHDDKLTMSHSVEEAQERHEHKQKQRKKQAGK